MLPWVFAPPDSWLFCPRRFIVVSLVVHPNGKKKERTCPPPIHCRCTQLRHHQPPLPDLVCADNLLCYFALPDLLLLQSQYHLHESTFRCRLQLRTWITQWICVVIALIILNFNLTFHRSLALSQICLFEITAAASRSMHTQATSSQTRPPHSPLPPRLHLDCPSDAHRTV